MTPPDHRAGRRILLVGLGIYHPDALTLQEPLGIGCVGAYLRQAGYEVRLHHMLDASGDSLLEMVRTWRPAIVGMSAYTSNWKVGRRVLRRLRGAFDGPIVLGGIHATIHPELALDPCLDFLVRGEGERTMLRLCDALGPGAEDPEGIPGLCFERDGRLIDTGLAPRIEDLDNLPIPMRQGLPMPRYRTTVMNPRFGQQRTASVSASRGCVYGCSFCTTPYAMSRRRHHRSVGHVMRELTWLREEHGVNAVYFSDEDLAFDRAWLTTLCEAMIEARLDQRWYCFARIGSVDPPLLATMRRAGCSTIGFGIESPDAASLSRIGKGVSPERIAAVLDEVHRAGLWSIGFVMVGLPWHDRATIEQASRFLRRTRLHILSPSFATPFPFTRMYDEAVEKGLIRVTDTDRYDNMRPVMATEHLDLSEIRTLHARMVQGFYGNPRYLARIARKITKDPVPILTIADAAGATLAKRLRSPWLD